MQDNRYSASDVVTRPSQSTDARQSTKQRRGLVRVAGIVFGVMLLLVGIAAAVWLLARSTDTTTETFGPTVERIVVDDINGSVTFEAGESRELTVEREWLFRGAPEVEIVESDGTLHISGDCGSWCRIHISGSAPAATAMMVETSAGSIDVAGFEAGVSLTTSAGNVTVTEVAGPTSLLTDAGWIRGTIVDGDVDAHTSAGGIDLEVRGDFSQVSATTDAGSVRVGVPDGVYRVEAETSLGSTKVNVSTDPSSMRLIVARSNAGNVRVDRLP